VLERHVHVGEHALRPADGLDEVVVDGRGVEVEREKT
jgi:hypothetical protein